MEKKKNRVKVTIAGTGFTLISSEEEDVTQAVAARLNREIEAVRKAAPGLSMTSAVMLAGMNLCDEMVKAQQDADALRGQIREYLNDAAKYRSAYEELFAETEKLRRDMEVYRRRLGDKGRTLSEPAPVSSAIRPVHRLKTTDTEEVEDESLSFFDTDAKRPDEVQ